VSIPVPKFNIGDVVYVVATDKQMRQWPCPDCKDTKIWNVTTPAGGAATMPCPRCTDRFGRLGDIPSLTYRVSVAHAVPLTIGRIQIDTETDSWCRDKVRYSRENSGSIYPEHKLFATEAEADAHAAAEQERLRETEQQLTPFVKGQHFSELTFRLAQEEYLWSQTYEAWARAKSLVEDLENLMLDEDTGEGTGEPVPQDDIDEAIRSFNSEQRYYRKNPVERLVVAARDAINLGFTQETRTEMVDVLTTMRCPVTLPEATTQEAPW